MTGAILPVLALIIYAAIGREDRASFIDEALVRLIRRVDASAELPLTAVERLAVGMTPILAGAGETLMRRASPATRSSSSPAARSRSPW